MVARLVSDRDGVVGSAAWGTTVEELAASDWPEFSGGKLVDWWMPLIGPAFLAGRPQPVIGC